MQEQTSHDVPGSGDDPFDERAFLITRNDAEAKICYANPAFAEISGYTMEELQGAPSNLLYHPDMPEQVSVDLWKTLKANGAWNGVMKHRRKDGRSFWADVTVTPTVIEGRHTGYTTVRSKPGAQKVALAEKAYRALKRGSSGFAVRNGRIVRTGLRGCMRWIRPDSVDAYLWQCFGILIVVAGALAADRYMASGGESGAVVSAIGLAGVLLLLRNGLSMRRRAVVEVRALVGICQRLAAGDLACELPDRETRDEIGELVTTLRAMHRSLISMVLEAQSITETVSGKSGEIVTANLELSARTDDQASALEETSAAMAELMGAVQSNADNARQAAQLAGEASNAAAQGAKSIVSVQSTMGSIIEGAGRVSGISAVIEGIAFQTNILALNAAVEAARAGAEGRGFAVVAAEVRNLAQRSAAAAKEIKELVNHSVDQSRRGADVVLEARQTIERIVASSESVSALVGRISVASEEQGRGIVEVGGAISQIDRTTQQNASMVEDAAAIAGVLSQQSMRLGTTMSAFHF
ncbi:Methyl-accepting chemotaxis sensory transducer with Pas/Pac sensor [Paraburkholderia unamae]|uniref:methyl-accepting chemotaxis protein n=1 Tax=Paraburkholderia unamae TaxID=219649 RepID=UPI000DC22961|nr:methyl-accepting chemotaxis protein [Paraburkholderia unamae]RAR48210.1 methyl-accepting chemotaxis sensory transducer with Pas/Pac sensor [Paraburkholderia unamae]CAG9258295.1 Methyl-accepting chemotaxis sensory transducer with Pas/Pac sensor [Paraburkholderia unamae]